MTQVLYPPSDKQADLPTISFITVCMGRLHHLKQTLPQNMADNRNYPRLEFVLLDYNSQDGMQEWVLENFPEELASGYLRYFHYADSEYFRFSHSRNLALRLTRGRIVCNVDADNYTGKDFAFYLADTLDQDTVLTGCKIKPDGELDPSMDEGSVGRLAAYREVIMDAGGYDEDMESWGFEDMDIYERLRDLGYRLSPVAETFKLPIQHNDEERARHVENKQIGRDTVYSEGTCYEHLMLSAENRAKGRYRVNENGYGMGEVTAFPGGEKRRIEAFRHRRITYCITCMDRLHHLQQTLPRNIQDNLAYPNQQFLVLDYNSSDGLEAWMREEMAEYIDTGLVRLFRTSEPDFFIKSHAMNMAFHQADGEIVVNLDADNYTGRNFSAFINDRFDHEEASFLMVDLERFPDRRDAVGRIAMRRTDFHRVRGYDERMDGYGWEDLDMCHRLEALGLRKQFIDGRDFLDYIRHGNEERVTAGKTYQKLGQLLKMKPPEQEYPSLYFLFKNQSYVLLSPTLEGRQQGNWQQEGNRLRLENGEAKVEFLLNGNDAFHPLDSEFSAPLVPMTDEEEINGAIIWFHLSENERLMKESIQAGRTIANTGPYGAGNVSLRLGHESLAQ